MKTILSISDEHDGFRLDQAASILIPACSRRQASACIQKGLIRINSLTKKPGYKVKKGDILLVNIPETDASADIVPDGIPFDILFEDDYLLVVNKSSDMVVHPAPGNLHGTLVNAAVFHCPDIVADMPDPSRPGVVHRLDKETSGVMVMAKTRQALDFLQREFKFRRVEKQYLALVSGQMAKESGEIDLPIGRHPVKRWLMAVNPVEGKRAVTCWTVLQQYADACLVKVLLKTGRTHQIRVHFYAIDHPLVGDPVYQPRRNRKRMTGSQRQMLHSWKLSFRHPYSGQRVSFTCDPPADFRKMSERLAQKR